MYLLVKIGCFFSKKTGFNPIFNAINIGTTSFLSTLRVLCVLICPAFISQILISRNTAGDLAKRSSHELA